MTARFSVLTVLRVSVIAMISLYAASIYLEMNLTISPEARQYQADYPDAIRNGFSLMGGLLELFALVGTIAGSVGAALLLLGSTRAVPYIFSAGPLIAVAAYLNAPQSPYPSVEPMLAEILWCATSAAWAGVVALTWVLSRGPGGGNSSQPSPYPPLVIVSSGSHPVIRTTLRVNPRPTSPSAGQLFRVAASGAPLAGTGQRWPESGAGDGNRKYRSKSNTHLNSRCYEIDRALRAIFV